MQKKRGIEMLKETNKLIDELKEAREDEKITRNALAKKCAVTNTTIMRMEEKRINITLDKFIRFASELGYSLKLVKNDCFDKIVEDSRTAVIKLLMDIRRIDQNDLANEMNCTQSYISKVLSGRKNLSEKTYTRISGILNVEEKDMFDMEIYYNLLDGDFSTKEKRQFTMLHALETILNKEHTSIDYNPEYKKMILKK